MNPVDSRPKPTIRVCPMSPSASHFTLRCLPVTIPRLMQEALSRYNDLAVSFIRLIARLLQTECQ